MNSRQKRAIAHAARKLIKAKPKLPDDDHPHPKLTATQPGHTGATLTPEPIIPLEPPRKQNWWQSKTYVYVSTFVMGSGLIAFAISLYAMRPIITVSNPSLLDPHDPYSVRFTVVNAGQLDIPSIEVNCLDNRIAFAGNSPNAPDEPRMEDHIFQAPTLRPIPYLRVSKLSPGDSFDAPCPQFVRAFVTNAHFVNASRETHHMQYVIGNVFKPPRNIEEKINSATERAVVEADITLVIKFRFPFLFTTGERRFRFITKKTRDGNFIWIHIAGDGKPIGHGTINIGIPGNFSREESK